MKKCPLYSLANKIPTTGITSISSDRCQPSCALYVDGVNECCLVILAKVAVEYIRDRRIANAKDITNDPEDL